MVFESILNNDNLNPYSSYKVIIGKTPIGVLIQIHPRFLDKEFDIKNFEVFAGEVYLNEIERFAKKSKVKFQDKTLHNIHRSLSVIFDKNLVIANILTTISKTKSVTNIAIADIFEDEKKLGLNKKSINIEFEIEQCSATLTKDEIDNFIVAEIISNLQSIGGIIRDGKTVE